MAKKKPPKSIPLKPAVDDLGDDLRSLCLVVAILLVGAVAAALESYRESSS